MLEPRSIALGVEPMLRSNAAHALSLPVAPAICADVMEIDRMTPGVVVDDDYCLLYRLTRVSRVNSLVDLSMMPRVACVRVRVVELQLSECWCRVAQADDK